LDSWDLRLSKMTQKRLDKKNKLFFLKQDFLKIECNLIGKNKYVRHLEIS